MGGDSAIPVRTRRVAGRIPQLRERSGPGAHEVAAALGISQSKIGRMESGHRAGGGVLVVTPSAWKSFLRSARDGRFDR